MVLIRNTAPHRTLKQEADTTLPAAGEDGSLTVNNDIVIDTTAPYVIAVLSLREGVYTMGQTVDLQVKKCCGQSTRTFQLTKNASAPVYIAQAETLSMTHFYVSSGITPHAHNRISP